MKTVRITDEQYLELSELAGLVPGRGSVNGLVQRAVDRLIKVEGPVHRAHYRALREDLEGQERQAVVVEMTR